MESMYADGVYSLNRDFTVYTVLTTLAALD